MRFAFREGEAPAEPLVGMKLNRIRLSRSFALPQSGAGFRLDEACTIDTAVILMQRLDPRSKGHDA